MKARRPRESIASHIILVVVLILVLVSSSCSSSKINRGHDEETLQSLAHLSRNDRPAHNTGLRYSTLLITHHSSLITDLSFPRNELIQIEQDAR